MSERIRTVKPEVRTSEHLAIVSIPARLTYVWLWTYADDAGRFRAAPLLLKAALFPLDEAVDCPTLMGWIAELEAAGMVRLYSQAGGHFGDIPSWGDHQRIDRPSTSRLPAWEEREIESPRETLAKPREASRPRARGQDRGPRTMDLGPGSLAPAKPSRPRNPIFDALAEECGMDPGAVTKSEGGWLGTAAAEIAKAGGSVEEIRVRAGRWRREHPEIALTPSTLAKHWTRLASERAVIVPRPANAAERRVQERDAYLARNGLALEVAR